MPNATSRATHTAALLRGPGDLGLEERDVPTPGPGEALVRVAAVGICGSDVAYFRGTAKYTPTAPFVMGHEASGVVAAVGTDDDVAAVGIRIGTRVALIPGSSCDTCDLCRSGRDNLCRSTRYLGSAAVRPHRDGALQEYLVHPVSHLLPLPDSVSLSTAALLEPLAVAHHAVSRADVADRRVLVVGAGAIGQLIALVARALGAGHVTVADLSERRRALAVEHGADRGLAPAAVADEATVHDVVFDASGTPAGVELCLRAAEPARGHVVLVGNLPPGEGVPAQLLTTTEAWVTATQRFPGGLAPALDLLTSTSLDVDWINEELVPFRDVSAAFSTPSAASDPVKKQIVLLAG